MARLKPDSQRIIAAQGLRAAGYAFTSVLLAALLAARGYSALLVGILLGCVVAGAAVGSRVFGRFADQRRATPPLLQLAAPQVGTTAPH